MEINKDISQKIVEEIYSIIGKNINIMDIQGRIIASIDKQRLGQLHEAALIVLKENRPVYVTASKKYERAQEGVNFPIEFQGKVIGVVGITGKADEVEKYGEIVKKISEILVKESFNEEYKRSRQNMISIIITQMLYSTTYNKEETYKLAHYSGIYSETPKCLILVNLIDIEDQYRVQMLLNRISQKLDVTIGNIGKEYFYTKVSEGLLLVLELKNKYPSQAIRRVIELLKYEFELELAHEVVMGVSDIYEDFYGLLDAYEQAKIALRVSKGNDMNAIFYNSLDLDILLLHTNNKVKRSFYDKVIIKIENDDILLTTLAEFFSANCSINMAADKLFIHKNTLQYRLNKVKELTGYDPRKFGEGVRLYTALKLRRLIT